MITYQVKRFCSHNYIAQQQYFRMDLKARLISARESAALNQSQLARLCGVTSQAINRLESGDSKEISTPLVFRLAEALKVNALWLGTGEGPRKPIAILPEPLPIRTVVELMRVMNEEGRREVLIFAQWTATRYPESRKANGVQ